ncbi:helix-turn-helix transcriptional regulator [uncultured Ruminococcus sp.]|uniref:helix-turn-helix domain-containing protein n=1 Tax=uncultured Ruminococcus sp. TaxID=165186 RepID=UPI00292D8B5C|nr:helix-turn-helix transcriptional regulator [uncultured Ruminococcus sp.]
MSFEETLSAYLEQLEIAPSRFAKEVGMSPSAVRRYLNGEREPAYDSDQLQTLARGICRLGFEKGVSFDETEVFATLQNSLKNNLTIDYEIYLSNLNALMKALDIRVSALAHGLSFDASHISKILSGQRRPGRITDFTHEIGSFISRSYADDRSLSILAKLFAVDRGALDSQRAVYDAVVTWLGTNTDADNSNPIGHFLDHMDSFSLDEFINVIHFNDIKLPTVPFHLPTTKYYTALDGMKKCEIDFLKATAVSKSREDCIMYSDMPIEKMAQDEVFSKKWMFGMAMLLKRGLHIHLIHDINRPFREMMLGLEGNIPMYMTGQISPYYLPGQQSPVLHYLIKVSGAAAMEGTAITGYHAEGKYLLTKADEELRFYRKKAERLLEKAKPLMDIYRSDRKQDYRAAMERYWREGDRMTVSAALPLFTLSQDALKAILRRNHISAKDAEEIERFRTDYLAIMTEFSKSSKLRITVPAPTKDEFEKNPIHLALAEMFYETDVPYTYEEYSAHLQATLAFAEQHRNITVKPDPAPVFRNITYSVIEKTAVIVSKNKFPTIHFIIHHKKMVDAFSGFVPLIKDAQTK